MGTVSTTLPVQPPQVELEAPIESVEEKLRWAPELRREDVWECSYPGGLINPLNWL